MVKLSSLKETTLILPPKIPLPFPPRLCASEPRGLRTLCGHTHIVCVGGGTGLLLAWFSYSYVHFYCIHNYSFMARLLSVPPQ